MRATPSMKHHTQTFRMRVNCAAAGQRSNEHQDFDTLDTEATDDALTTDIKLPDRAGKFSPLMYPPCPSNPIHSAWVSSPY